MDTMKQIAAVLVRVVRSRLFAAAALAVVTAGMVTYVSVNTHAVTVVDGSAKQTPAPPLRSPALLMLM